MLNSGKKDSRFCDKKKYSNSRVVRKKISERRKTPYPPPLLQGKRSVPKIVLTLDPFLWRPVTYRVARLCTFSILSILFLWYGSQNVVAYSSSGLTRDLFVDLSLIFRDLICRFRCRNPRLRLALFVMLLMC